LRSDDSPKFLIPQIKYSGFPPTVHVHVCICTSLLADTTVLRIPDHSHRRTIAERNKRYPLKDSLELFFASFLALGWNFGVHSNHWSLLSGTAQHRTSNGKTQAIWVSL